MDQKLRLGEGTDGRSAGPGTVATRTLCLRLPALWLRASRQAVAEVAPRRQGRLPVRTTAPKEKRTERTCPTESTPAWLSPAPCLLLLGRFTLTGKGGGSVATFPPPCERRGRGSHSSSHRLQMS